MTDQIENLGAEYRLLMGHPVDYRRTVHALTLIAPELVMQHLVFSDYRLVDQIREIWCSPIGSPGSKKREAIRLYKAKAQPSLEEAKKMVNLVWKEFERDM
jgi:hypothetical protein